MKDQLVSVIVVTYNSSKYIIETLESVRHQTYQNIELIITDDCSDDNTVDICNKWLKSNHLRFARTKILTGINNIGTSKNINRGCRSAKGEWLKTIGGDDIFLKTCIEDYVNCIKHKKVNFIFSQVKLYYPYETNRHLKLYPSSRKIWRFNKLNSKGQIGELALSNDLMAITFFANRIIFEKHNFFDEEFRLVEDYPTWLKLLSSGEVFYIHEMATSLYRKHQNSVSYNGNKAFSEDFFFMKQKLYDRYLKNNVSFFIRWHIIIEFCIKRLVIKAGNTKIIYRFINKLFLLSPIYYITKYRELKDVEDN